MTYAYKWNEMKSRLELDKKSEQRLANGIECYPVIKWTNNIFGQLPVGKDIALKLSYKFKGVKRQISCAVPTVQCEDFWKLGIIIDQSLKLKVFLGTERNYAESAPLNLELK